MCYAHEGAFFFFGRLVIHSRNRLPQPKQFHGTVFRHVVKMSFRYPENSKQAETEF